MTDVDFSLPVNSQDRAGDARLGARRIAIEDLYDLVPPHWWTITCPGSTIMPHTRNGGSGIAMVFLSRPEPTDPRPIYEQIMSEVRKAIVRGSLRAGDGLPSTRQLALDLRVNPNTVQQAYRELEREGVIYVLRGRGSFVCPTADHGVMRESMVSEIAATAVRAAAKEGIGADVLASAIAEIYERERAGAEG